MLQITLLENVRFYAEETKNVPEFAQKMAANADMFVNDAFGTAHRAHASTEGVTKFLSPSVAGFLLQKELDYLEGAVQQPKRPFAAIVGGSKVRPHNRYRVITTITMQSIGIGGTQSWSRCWSHCRNHYRRLYLTWRRLSAVLQVWLTCFSFAYARRSGSQYTSAGRVAYHVICSL